MRKALGALVLAVLLTACNYPIAAAPSLGEPTSSPSPSPPAFVFKLEKDRESQQTNPNPTATPTPIPLLVFTKEEIEIGQVQLSIPIIFITAPLEVAQEELRENGPVFTKPGENPLWVPGWGAEIGAEGVALIYGHRQWGPIPRIFSDLDKLAVGNIIEVTQGKEILSFTVFDIFVVEPEDFWEFFFSMDDQALSFGASQIALFTCTPWGTAEQRLIVMAQLLQD